LHPQTGSTNVTQPSGGTMQRPVTDPDAHRFGVA
jgi:hypothetical protein